DADDRARAVVGRRAPLLGRVAGEVLAVVLDAGGREETADAGGGVARHLAHRRERRGDTLDGIERLVRRDALADRDADDPAVVAAAARLGDGGERRGAAVPLHNDRRWLSDAGLQRFADVAVDV